MTTSIIIKVDVKYPKWKTVLEGFQIRVNIPCHLHENNHLSDCIFGSGSECPQNSKQILRITSFNNHLSEHTFGSGSDCP